MHCVTLIAYLRLMSNLGISKVFLKRLDNIIF